MKHCKNGRIIPFLEAKMGFDSGPGIMYRGQALLLCQVIGKLPLADAELAIKHASSRSYALFDYFKREFIKSAQEQGYSFLHATNEWYRIAFQAGYIGFAPCNQYIQEKYALMSKIYETLRVNQDMSDDQLKNSLEPEERKRLKTWDDMIHTVKMIARNQVSDEDTNP
ncbi:MAG: hypothetical protein IJB05_10425 [Bacteroidales bacterium]|nr:hypothetical protein [Bacteroidales bacterium]